MSEWGGDTAEETAGGTSRPGAQEVSGGPRRGRAQVANKLMLVLSLEN